MSGTLLDGPLFPRRCYRSCRHRADSKITHAALFRRVERPRISLAVLQSILVKSPADIEKPMPGIAMGENSPGPADQDPDMSAAASPHPPPMCHITLVAGAARSFAGVRSRV